jgi:protein TonB
MFEDSLVESQNRIHTRSRWFAIGSFLIQAAVLVMLILSPLYRPAALPRQSLDRLLVAPLPPQAPAHLEAHRAAAQSSPERNLPSLQAQLLAPRQIPDHVTMLADAPPISGSAIGPIGSNNADGVLNGVLLGSAPPTVAVLHPPAARRPLTVSSGVAAGQLLSPIRPIYPAIAKSTRTQGTVVIEATISRQGTIENLRVVGGPPLLRQAAIDAVAAARYKPFLLNGEPVEVQTNINIIFSLGG